MSQGARHLPTREIVAQVCRLSGDPGNKEGDGYYNRHVVSALRKLGMKTLFDKRTFTADIGTRAVIDVPKDLLNVDSIHLFNGDECNLSVAQNVYYKEHYSPGGRSDMVAENHGYNDSIVDGGTEHPYYWNMQQGVLILSPQCMAFQKVFVGYRGSGAVFGDEPLVPAVLEEVTVHLAARAVVQEKYALETRQWGPVLTMLNNRIEGRDGLLAEAKHNIQMPDIKAWKDGTKYASGHGLWL